MRYNRLIHNWYIILRFAVSISSVLKIYLFYLITTYIYATQHVSNRNINSRTWIFSLIVLDVGLDNKKEIKLIALKIICSRRRSYKEKYL